MRQRNLSGLVITRLAEPPDQAFADHAPGLRISIGSASWLSRSIPIRSHDGSGLIGPSGRSAGFQWIGLHQLSAEVRRRGWLPQTTSPRDLLGRITIQAAV